MIGLTLIFENSLQTASWAGIVHWIRLQTAFVICLFLASCAPGPPLATPTPLQWTDSIRPNSVEAAVAEITRAIEAKDAQTLGPLLNERGIYFVLKWPGGVGPGQLYSTEIAIDVLGTALSQGEASCIGYNPAWGSNTALVVFADILVDWRQVGAIEPVLALTGFILSPADGRWGITHVLRVDPMAHVREIVDLDQCPGAEPSSMERRNALDESM